MQKALSPIVAVPVRNEQRRLHRFIESLAAQTWFEQPGRRLPVILVVNNSQDGSATLAAELFRQYSAFDPYIIDIAFAPAEANVGTARRLAMELACGQLQDLACGVIMTTDADARPDPNWVVANLAAIADGADLVGGLIIGDPIEENELGMKFVARSAANRRYKHLVVQLESMLNPVAHDAWPRHGDHTGASLAVRASVYRAVGGLPALPTGEDLAFVENVALQVWHIRHAPDVKVVVSARLSGRAQGGMADCIRGWVEAENRGSPFLVEHPECTLSRFMKKTAVAFSQLPDEREAISSTPHTSAIELFTAQNDILVQDAIAYLEKIVSERRLIHAA